jgi:hypothetical protein
VLRRGAHNFAITHDLLRCDATDFSVVCDLPLGANPPVPFGDDQRRRGAPDFSIAGDLPRRGAPEFA